MNYIIYFFGSIMAFIFTSSAMASSLQDFSGSKIPNIPDLKYSKKIGNLIKNEDLEYTQLLLNVSINNNISKDLILIRKNELNKFFINSNDLHFLRVLVNDDISKNNWLSIDDLQGINFEYDEQKQSLKLIVPDHMLLDYSINLHGQDITDSQMLKTKQLNALIVNYNAYGAVTDNKDYFSGIAEGIFNSKYGNLSSGFSYSSNRNDVYEETNKLIRLDSKWQYVNPEKIRIYTLGDFISNASDWGSSLRLSGVQWSSAYAQRSDIVTSALPQFSGTAILPSTLDLYVNQDKIYTGEIPAGPFDVKQLPFISGNELTMVTTDLSGQQTIIKKPYYFSPKILAKGINQFSIDIGVPRYNYGHFSNDYDENVVFSSGSLRYGYKQDLTLSAGVEASTDGLFNSGFGFAKNIFNRGIINADLSTSQYKNEAGYSALLGIEGRLNKSVSFNTSYRKIVDNYYDLARVSQIRYVEKYNNIESPDYLTYSALADSIFRIGLNYNFYAGYGIYLGYNQIKDHDNSNEILFASFNGHINKNWGFYSSAYKNYKENSDNNDYGVQIALNYRPSTKVNTISKIMKNDKNSTYRQEINGATGQALGAMTWGGYVERNTKNHDTNGGIYASYNTRPAFITGSYTQVGNQNQMTVSASGSLVAAAGQVFAANRIGDGYAIIKNAGPKSQILNSGVKLGSTDKSGSFLISDLRPYYKNDIYVDTSYLPLQWEIPSTAQTAIVGYRQGTVIDFKAKRVNSGLIKLVDKDNVPIAPGYSVLINGDQVGIVGYDGNVFISNILPNNTLQVDLLDLGSCNVTFSSVDKNHTTKQLGPYLCQ